MLNLHLTKDENELIKASLPHLKLFINEMQGFYPFAMIMDNKKKISSTAPEIEDEYPNSQYLIDFYEECFKNEFNKLNCEYCIALICIDIFIHEKIDNIDMKKNAIEFRLITSLYRKTVRLFYEINDKNEVVFMDWNL